MPDTIPTLRLRSSEDLARDLGGSAGRVTMALDEDLRVRGRAHTAIASRVWGYQVMLDLGCDKLDIIDQINGDLDIFRDLDGRLRRDLDELGLLRDEELDLSGLEALKGRLDAETSTRARMVRR
jgi:hypothetical protein